MAKFNKPKMGFISKLGLAADIFFTGYSLISMFTSPAEIGKEEVPTKEELKTWDDKNADENLKSGLELGKKPGYYYEVIKADPDSRELAKELDSKTTENKTEINTVAKALGSMLADLNLANDDNDENTDYLYDLYFITDLKERALKRWPTIRNYQNLYSFSAMLKETKQESTYEEMVILCFYFRMV